MALYYNGTSSGNALLASAYLQTNWGSVGAVTPELPGNVVPYVESFEIKGHFEARLAQRALNLIRLSWGWYLNNPHGTQSTFLEGYGADGSFRYRDSGYNRGGSYTSHAHGWSTGPTDALTTYIVGLRPITPGGARWSVEPQFGDLKSAEGGFTIPKTGKFSAGWVLTGDGKYNVTINVPASTSGVARLPFPNGKPPKSVTLDSKPVTYTTNSNDRVVIVQTPGGKHSIVVSS